ncbi:hypothetical protein E2P81_ATG07280 [Venturia nashicola]|uniref:Conserved oligomeric Golgi complex subunit 1 n=1 Tax=Venturia nashicola TaxID=86259 RepID=A0A4Z1P663_9PEZI|nr:hypothetical protein E6O75_ATG07440 [Venturia nashicola]TLD31790.1 hypothetical protein E2P81_ATG07280 [Venturia nashicola]
MTNEGPDPLTFKSWEDAFQYPIPQVRKLEQQLRSHGEDNRHKLRNLVGISYRELLGTAERIIDMDERMHEVDLTLGLAGQKCNSRAVDRIFKNQGRLQIASKARVSQRNALAAHLAILQTCPTIITRLLKRGGSSLLAAKILLLSRLTHKTLSQESEAAPFIESLRNRLASLRQKTLSAIDKRLASTDNDVHGLVQDMCAFSLATSSTPTDVLRHFHAVRLKAVVWHLEQEIDTRKHVVDAVNLLLATLRDSQLIFPKRLSDALAKLKELPLMRQPDVLSVTELNFDLHERWVADELRNYTPWPRHDELNKSEADKQLKLWAKQALKTFMSGLETALAGQSDFKHVMNVRKDLLDAWPWSDTQLPGLHSADVVDGFRDILNTRLVEIIHQSAGQLRRLPVAISGAIEHDNLVSETSTTLWDHSLTAMDYGNGATSFKQAVLARYYGGEVQFAEIVPIFDTWTEGITSIRRLLKEMRDGRWDDDITEDADDLDSRQALLSEDDPRTLEETLETSLEDVAKNLHAALLKIVKSVGKDASSKKSAKAIFLLRLLREMSQRSASQERRLAAVSTTSTRSIEILHPLQAALVTSATTPAIKKYAKSLSKMMRLSSLEARTLWEGNPQLPVQPSSTTFRFLKRLTRDMADAGADLWAEGPLRAAKLMLMEQLNAVLSRTLGQLEESSKKEKVNGHPQNGNEEISEEDEEEEEDEDEDEDSAKLESDALSSETEADATSPNSHVVKKEKSTQLLLDVLYLQKAFELDDTPSRDKLNETIDDILSNVGLGETEVARIRKSAMEYWKRTYLLFALLSGGT